MLADNIQLERFRRETAAVDIDLLLVWVDRASSLVVRHRDADLLVVAIFGFGFTASASAPMHWIHLQAQLRQAGRIIGRDADEAWAAAVARSDADGAAWLDTNRGRRRFLRARFTVEQFSDPYDGGRFRYGAQ